VLRLAAASAEFAENVIPRVFSGAVRPLPTRSKARSGELPPRNRVFSFHRCFSNPTARSQAPRAFPADVIVATREGKLANLQDPGKTLPIPGSGGAVPPHGISHCDCGCRASRLCGVRSVGGTDRRELSREFLVSLLLESVHEATCDGAGGRKGGVVHGSDGHDFRHRAGEKRLIGARELVQI
jgi:hypothetical protein